MRTYARYSLTFVAVLVYFFILFHDFEEHEKLETISLLRPREEGVQQEEVLFGTDHCSMETCFNFSRCLTEPKKVYITPSTSDQSVSLAYQKILTALNESYLITHDPREACVSMLAIDTTDRDRISENYVRDVDELIAQLPSDVWNDGENFVIFNIYHGTYPDYSDHNLGFNIGKAMIARSSPSIQNFRFGFDIGFPLFHKEHELRARKEREYDIKPVDQYLVSFKGKRYVYGIGSETRDALHHLHNGKTVAMLTTCKHNHDWQEHQDSRCELDNAEYDKWDYSEMMMNSTFCLTPRGRRLGSFRFLEALRAGCIPVVLSDDWVLPFAEAIDWSKAVVVIPEESVLLVPDILASFTMGEIVEMKQECHRLYDLYFRDVQQITVSTFEIIFDRIRTIQRLETISNRHLAQSIFKLDEKSPIRIVIIANKKSTSQLQHLIDSLVKIVIPTQIIIIWPSDRGVPPSGATFGHKIAISFIEMEELYLQPISDGIVMIIDERMDISDKTIRKSLYYIKNNGNRLIGTTGMIYEFDTGTIAFAESYNCLFSSFLTFHGYYLNLLKRFLPTHLAAKCPLVGLNVLISEYCNEPPMVLEEYNIRKWMNLSSEAPCWKEMALRYPTGPSIFTSNLIFS